MKLLNRIKRKTEKQTNNSKDAAKERLHLVLMQDRANVSADFLELMKQEIIEVIKKYIEVDENAIDVRLTNKENEDGTNGAPALYANIPIMNIKDEIRQNSKTNVENSNKESIDKNKEISLEEAIEQKLETVMERVQEEKEREMKQRSYNQETQPIIENTQSKEEKENEIKEVNMENKEEGNAQVNTEAQGTI